MTHRQKTNVTIKPGDFVFFKTSGFSPWIIRDMQKRLYPLDWISQVNHCAVCVGPGALLREAEIPRAIIRPNNIVSDRTMIALVRPTWFESMSAVNHLTINDFLQRENQIGLQWYGLPQVLGMIYVYYRLISGSKKAENPIHAGRICTEDCMYFKLNLESFFHVKDPVNSMVTDVNSIFPATLLLMFLKSTYYDVYRLQ